VHFDRAFIFNKSLVLVSVSDHKVSFTSVCDRIQTKAEDITDRALATTKSTIYM